MYSAASDIALPEHSFQADGAGSHHLFWIIPDYRTSASLHPYAPLTVKEKFKVAGEDSWDRGTLALATLFGGEAQLANSNRPFGQGLAGYSPSHFEVKTRLSMQGTDAP